MEREKTIENGNKSREFDKSTKADVKVQEYIVFVEEGLSESIEPVELNGLNSFQRKQIHQYFEKTNEYKIKSYKETDSVFLRVYPVGQLKRIAEQKTQEVLMMGKSESLPPMGSFSRFVIHDYLKERNGIRTESRGEERKDRHIVIYPLFGREPKKTKRRLVR